MTKDRVRQLAEQLYIDVPDSPSADPDKTLAIFERAILAALDESWAESATDEMRNAAWGMRSASFDDIFAAMSAVRRAALKEGL